jgi:hypothetical protein
LTVQCIERDDGGGVDAEFGQQGLGCGDLIRFLGDVDMGTWARTKAVSVAKALRI